VYTGPNFNAGLQAGQRQAAANTAEMGAAPTGEVKKGSPLVPSATKQTGQPGSLFKGLAQGAAESLKAASSETAAAQVGASGWKLLFCLLLRQGLGGDCMLGLVGAED
jgi:hypothetical protein